jgi:hypothetical protein
MIQLHSGLSSLVNDKDAFLELLRRLPYTRVMNFLRGLETLNSVSRSTAVEATVKHANQYIESIIDPAGRSRPTNFEEISTTCNLGIQVSGWEGFPLKSLKQLVGAMKSTKPGAKRMLGDCPVDPELIRYVDGLETVTAPQMRKEVKAYLGDRFGLLPKNVGYGDWEYSSPERQIRLCLDFGGSWGQQIRYWLSHPLFERLSIELICGIGIGDWDFIHRGNIQDSMCVLGDIYQMFENLATEQDAPPDGDKHPV